MKRYLIIEYILLAILQIFLGGIFSPAIAQFQNNVPQVKPMSPNAAAMFKVLERPIGTYTGTVPVNFSLVTLNSGPLTASLSLDYNSTGGIRVEEVASSVGLGFSFSDGGGRIVQTVNGLQDDMNAGLLTNAKKPSAFNCSDITDIFLSTVPYQLDLEADIFMYNLNGKSGKFFFKENGTIVISENSGIRIEYDTASVPSSGIRQWIITDAKGNKYYFGQNKSKTINYRAQSSFLYQSTASSASKSGLSSRTWYLVEAYDMNEENTLKYNYVNAGEQLTTFSGGFYAPWKFGSCISFNTAADEATVNTILDEYFISRIDGSSGYILVNSAEDRQDGAFGRKVNNIELYDSSGIFKKRLKFNYGYFNAGDADVTKRRLKLNHFSEFGSNGTDSLTYKFTYAEAQNLPSRFSNSVDHWGFFNNQFNNSHFPNLYYKYGIYVIREVNNADRSAVPLYAQANILTKISYPTGGYREFVYEGNTALLNTTNEHFLDPEYTAHQSFSRSDFSNFIDPAVPCLTHNFTINSTDGGAIFKYYLQDVDPFCSNYFIKLFKVATSGETVGGAEVYSYNDISEYSRELVNGYYRLEVYKSSPGCTFGSLNADWGESTLSTAMITTPNGSYNRNNIKVGGVRIKQINDFDPISNKFNTTEYKYKLYSTDSTFTSGLLVTPIHMVSYENPGSWDGQYLAVHTSSCYPLATVGGSYVVYPEVRTTENGNGWIDRMYSYTPDGIDGSYPVVSPPDYSYLRGRLLSERYYDQSGTLLRKTISDYVSADGGGGQLGIRNKPYYYGIMDPGVDRESPIDANEVPTHADCRDFYTTVNSYLPNSKTDSLFSSSGKFATKMTYNYYGYRNQLLLKKIQTTINGNAVKETIYKYSFNPNMGFTLGLTTAEQAMKVTLLDKNYLQPLEVVDSLKPATGNGSFLNGVKYIYGTVNSNKIHVLKARNYTSPTDYTEINLSGYDVKGNLTEQYKTNDIKEVYLWGYKKQYPVAKITGSDYTTVSALVNDNILNAPASDAALRTELNKIRTGLAGSQAMVTTYTYLPLVGITSETDPSGKVIYYEYDAFKRLILIRDQDNNILKKIEYKLVGPQ